MIDKHGEAIEATLGGAAPAGDHHVAINGEAIGVTLYLPDGNHSSNVGAYLTACVFYSVIHRESPAGLPATITTPKTTLAVSAEDAALFQNLAWEVSEEWRRNTKAWFLRNTR